MVVDETIVYTPNLDEHLLIASNQLHPIICQIGGRNVDYCTKAVKAVREYGYDEVNLNVDCPSGRVSGKRLFGAVLMAEEHQETCLEVVSAMKESSACELYDRHDDVDRKKKSQIPISVKTRVGIQTDDGQCHDNIKYVSNFLSQLHHHGCNRFVIHARICVIGGLLSPAQNRLVPPLNYPRVYELCRRFPDCEFVINGGIPGLKLARDLCFGINDDCGKNDNENQHHVVPCKICNAPNGSCTAPPSNPQSTPSNLKGCMIGRACMENPSMFWDVDRYFYGMDDNPYHTRREVLDQYCLYLEETYPRRCCDDDDSVTMRIPCPKVDLPNWGCSICNDYYGSCNLDHDNEGMREESTSEQRGDDDERKIKISSRVIDRSLKPILGIFFGLPKSKLFRRECDRLSRDKSIRNCGPGYIVRRAMSVMPQELLDLHFVKTEDLDFVPTHVSPSNT